MTIEAAKPEQVFEIADSFGIELSADDAKSFAGLMNGIKASYDRLDELVEPTLPVKYDRSPGVAFGTAAASSKNCSSGPGRCMA